MPNTHKAILITALALLFSCQHKHQNKSKPSTQKIQTPSNINTEQFLSKSKNEDRFIVLLTHPSCNISPRIKAKIKQDNYDWNHLYYMSGEEGQADEFFMKDHIPFTGIWPVLFAVEGGKTVDIVIAPNNLDVIKNFIERNIYQTKQKPRDLDNSEFKSFRNTLTRVNYNTPVNLEGIDLSGVRLNGRSFSGFNLRNANFSNASLERISFSRADLTGARFHNTKIKNIFWGDTICPDGTLSREHDYTCSPEGMQRKPDSSSAFEDQPSDLYVTQKPTIKTNSDGAVELDGFLLGTAWMLGRKRKTLYQKPTLLDRKEGFEHIKSNSKHIHPALKQEPESFDYYLFLDKAKQRSFILTIPTGKSFIFPHETTMYPYDN
jgi:hypothetical protein